MRLSFSTSFLNLDLTLFEQNDSSSSSDDLVSNVGGQFEPAPVEEYEYEDDDPEGFGFRG